MESFFSALTSPGSWTQTQWLAVLIGLFVVAASCYFVWKLYQIIRNAGKSTYQPNIGRARLRQQRERQQREEERERHEDK